MKLFCLDEIFIQLIELTALQTRRVDLHHALHITINKCY